MGEFRFKQFTVRNEASAMKVNTDGVLLGGAMTISPSDRILLDVGTGTGTVALMAAQRLCGMLNISQINKGIFNIQAIDSDLPSATEAAFNFNASPWKDNLAASHCPLENYEPGLAFDLIFSNPPFFESSLKAPDPRRRSARHTGTLSYREILAFASRHLSPSGRVSLILPADCERELLMNAAALGLHPFRILLVGTVPGKPFSRIIAEFARSRPASAGSGVALPASSNPGFSRLCSAAPVREEMFIHSSTGGYSDAYHTLLKDFLIIF